jgi:hypothetical protein
MSNNPKNAPPPEVIASAAVVQKWLDEQPKPGAGNAAATQHAAVAVPDVAKISAADRFNQQRMQQLEQSRAEEPNLRKARS